MPEHKLRAFGGADPDQEGAGASLPNEARRLRIEIDEPRSRGHCGVFQKQLQRLEVCGRKLADPELAVRPPERERLPRREVTAPVVRRDLALNVGVDPARHALRGQRLRDMLPPPQVLELALELAVARALLGRLLQLSKLFF